MPDNVPQVPLNDARRMAPVSNEMYVQVQGGVRRIPEEIYDQASATHVQQSVVVLEQGYADAYDLEQETFV